MRVTGDRIRMITVVCFGPSPLFKLADFWSLVGYQHTDLRTYISVASIPDNPIEDHRVDDSDDEEERSTDRRACIRVLWVLKGSSMDHSANL